MIKKLKKKKKNIDVESDQEDAAVPGAGRGSGGYSEREKPGPRNSRKRMKDRRKNDRKKQSSEEDIDPKGKKRGREYRPYAGFSRFDNRRDRHRAKNCKRQKSSKNKSEEKIDQMKDKKTKKLQMRNLSRQDQDRNRKRNFHLSEEQEEVQFDEFLNGNIVEKSKKKGPKEEVQGISEFDRKTIWKKSKPGRGERMMPYSENSENMRFSHNERDRIDGSNQTPPKSFNKPKEFKRGDQAEMEKELKHSQVKSSYDELWRSSLMKKRRKNRQKHKFEEIKSGKEKKK